jgi:hypothetical protein
MKTKLEIVPLKAIRRSLFAEVAANMTGGILAVLACLQMEGNRL